MKGTKKNKYFLYATLILWFLLLLNQNQVLASGSDTDYTQNGDNWTDDAWANGKTQSPINIDTSQLSNKDISHVDREFPILAHTTTEYNGHAKIETVFEVGEIFYKDEDEQEEEWESLQFHYHAPSEHTINDKQFAAEMHLVFTSKNIIGRYQVLGILFEYDEDAEDIELLEDIEIGHFTVEVDEEREISTVNLEEFYHLIKGSYLIQYQGSLTTPPWTEGVRWLLLRDQIKINEKQLDYFKSLLADNDNFAHGHGNNRNTQPLYGRKIYRLDEDSSIGHLWIILGVLATALAVIFIIALSFYHFRQQNMKELQYNHMTFTENRKRKRRDMLKQDMETSNVQ